MTIADQPDPKTYTDKSGAHFERGHTGDATILPALKNAFDNSELAAKIGDVHGLAREVMLSMFAGRSLTAREAIRPHRSATRSVGRIGGAGSPEAACRPCGADVGHHAVTELAVALKKNPAESPVVRAAKRRARAAQAWYLAAIRALAAVRKARAAATVLDRLGEAGDRRGTAGTEAGPWQPPEAVRERECMSSKV